MSGCNGVMASATHKNSVEDVRAAESIGEEVAMSPGREQGESGDTSVQTLVGNGMSKVPARFIRTESELISFTPHNTMSLEPIPMIDLEGLHDYRRQFTMAAISSACRHWGCFQACMLTPTTHFIQSINQARLQSVTESVCSVYADREPRHTAIDAR